MAMDQEETNPVWEGILFPIKENNLDLGLGPVKKLIWTKVSDQTEM